MYSNAESFAMSDGIKRTHKEQTFDTELGSKAIVEHHAYANPEHAEALRLVLKDIALDLQRVGEVPKEMDYCGSWSVHVFKGGLNNFAFIGVTNPENSPYIVAEAASKKLFQDIREFYQGKRQKLRSGF
jgi:hypothetical protein